MAATVVIGSTLVTISMLLALQDSRVMVDEAGVFVRDGLLRQAEAVLARVPDTSTASDRARAALLSGNIAYDRGHYALAEQRYAEASVLYRQASRPDGVDVAEGNRQMSRERLDRMAVLDEAANNLMLWLGISAAGAAFGVTLLARRTRLA